jgi:hypothetical protein
LCGIIPQQPNDIHLREVFKEGLWTKIIMDIISMLRKTLTQVAEFAIIVE